MHEPIRHLQTTTCLHEELPTWVFVVVIVVFVDD